MGRGPRILVVLAALIAGLAAPATAAAQGRSARQAAACLDVAIGPGAGERRCLPPASGRTTWFRDCATCPEMVVVPAGRLPPGADASQRRPVVRAVRQPFAVGRFAVTFDEWDVCVADGGCNGHRAADQGWGRGNRPVIDVSFEDATAYVAWLSAKTGKRYRLPTATEREFVARAGTATAYWWGDDIDLDRANYDVPRPSRRMPNADYSEIRRLKGRTVPVDGYAANPWGLYNVHGNVWEWTSDCHVAERSLAAAEGSACGERVAIGGSWNDFAEAARSAYRVGYNATARNPLQGFRVVRALP